MIIRGILYIGGKWYGMEPLNTSSTSEHVFYQLEDMQDIPFQCGVLNGSLHHEEMFVKQPVKYEFLSNSTSSRETLLRVNIFLLLSCKLQSKPPPQSVPAAEGLQSSCSGVVSLQVGLPWQPTSSLPSFSWIPNWWESC